MEKVQNVGTKSAFTPKFFDLKYTFLVSWYFYFIENLLLEHS